MTQKTTLLVLLLTLCPFMMQAQAKVNVWQGTGCKRQVEMTPYLATGQGNTAVVVCPGGSYFWHDMGTEGAKVGEWLQRNGISAFVLHYRTAGLMAFLTRYRYWFRGCRYPDALDDVRQTLNYVRDHADEYGICAANVGIMGFSAGGHLAMSAGELLAPKERPAFIAPIYPVVTMTENCAHKRSRRGLMGDRRKNDRLLRDSLSLERHVPRSCPPVFLVNCADDPVVKCHNAELLDSALTVCQVPHRYIQYKTGGHGFGASECKGTSECRQWKTEFLRWLKDLGK